MASDATVKGEAEPAWLTPIRTAQQHLGRAIWSLSQQTEPAFDLAPLGPTSRQACAAVFDALDLRSDPLDGIRRATQHVDTIVGALAADPSGGSAHALNAARAARAALDEAEKTLSRLPIAPRPALPGPLTASSDIPRLHEVERASLAPDVTLASPPAPPPDEPLEPLVPVTFEELEANIAMLKMRAEDRRELAASKRRKRVQTEVAAPEIPEGFGPDIPDRASEGDFVRARTRDMLEEVAMVGLQRTPLPGDPWRLALGLEQRMGRAIDAIAAMGEVALGSVERWALDSPVKDDTRLFAVAMAMGCFAGEDALGVVERVYREFVSVDPECREGLVAGLSLAPHPGIGPWMRRWHVDPDPAHRSIAVETLAFRGWLDDNELANAALDEPQIARYALPALARQAPRAALDVLEDPLGSDDPDLRLAAWRAMVLANRSRAIQVLWDAIDGEDAPFAAALLALCDDEAGATRLLDRMKGEPTPWLVEAVGWSGSVSSLGPLLALLEGDDEALVVAAATALDRITGAELREEAEMIAEDIFVPEPPDPDVGEPAPKRLVRMTSDPRDLPPEPATEMLERPSTDPAAWQRWYQEHATDWPARQRFRLGKPYTPATSLAELDHGRRDPHERHRLLDELVIQTGVWVRMDPHDYVVVQQAALLQWEGPAQRGSSQPGRWERASRR